MSNDQVNVFVSATEDYTIDVGAYSFLICKHDNSEDCSNIEIKCKRLKTALNKVVKMIDSENEIIDYEVAVHRSSHTTFINLYSLPSTNNIKHYLG